MIRFKEAQESDLELTMAWRSNPLVYQGFYTQGKASKGLVWEEHLSWFRSRNKDWRTFIIEYEGRKVGVVTIGQLDHWSPEIGLYVGEISLWGQGIGKQSVKAAMEYIRNYGRTACHTTIPVINDRALRLFRGLGFEELGQAREGEIWVQKLSI